MESNYKNNIVLVSDFGRSGQGWLSYMLCFMLNARFIEPYNFLSGTTYSSSKTVIDLTSGSLPGREKTHYSLVVKTHNYPSAEFNLTEKVIFLIRDPRDVAVSMHNLNLIHQKRVGWNHPRAKFFLLLYTYFPIIDYLQTIRNWTRHYKAWQGISSHVVRYEDLLHNPKQILQGVLDYLQIRTDDEIINEAITTFSFEKITGRKRGEEDKNNPEFRKGISGDYKNKFSKLDIFIIDSIFKKIIRQCNYDI